MKPANSLMMNRKGNQNLFDEYFFSGMSEGIRPGGLQLTDNLFNLCGFNRGDMIADVGCGSGISLDFINRNFQVETAGVDLSGFLLKAGIKKFPSLQLIQGDGKSLPFRDESVNGVLAECSLSVMDDPRKVLSEIWRVLADYGRLAVSDVYLRQPEYSESIKKLPLNGCLSGAFVYDEIVSMLADSGFKPVLWEDHSDLWREFVAGILLNNDSLCGIVSSGTSGDNPLFLLPEVIKSKPGYFCLVAEKNNTA